jgi:hypothetical protein
MSDRRMSASEMIGVYGLPDQMPVEREPIRLRKPPYILDETTVPISIDEPRLHNVLPRHIDMNMTIERGAGTPQFSAVADHLQFGNVEAYGVMCNCGVESTGHSWDEAEAAHAEHVRTEHSD